MDFNFSAKLIESSEYSYWFLFKGSCILLENMNGKKGICKSKDFTNLGLKTSRHVYFGKKGNENCFCAEIISDNIPEGFELVELRKTYDFFDENNFSISTRAYQIVNWDVTHSFCSKCGKIMTPSDYEFAKICPSCNFTAYPRISPAIIVAIIKNGKILLARRADYKMYSVIAGYVEAGETIEETVYRETIEEVGIKVKNIRYFTSQPWAFSYSLMLAFTAEYDSGEIRPDGDEISEAYWFSPDELPDLLPGKISVAGKLLEWFKTTYSK